MNSNYEDEENQRTKPLFEESKHYTRELKDNNDHFLGPEVRRPHYSSKVLMMYLRYEVGML